METPNMQKVANRGVFKSFADDSLTVTVPVYNQDTGVKEDLDINYNVISLQQQADALEAEITEKRKEKNQILALLEKFQPDVDLAKFEASAESAIVEEEPVITE